METTLLSVDISPSQGETSKRWDARHGAFVYAITATLVVILFCAFSLLNRVPVFPLDDAYITLHNALVLAGSPEVNFAGTPALAGATSAPHTVLVAALCRILSPPWALLVSAWFGILLYALGVAHLTLVYKLSRIQTGLLLFLALFAGSLTLHLLNGLETGLALAGLTWALALASESKPSRALCAVCASLPFVRPELAALSVLLMAHQVWRRLREERSDAVRQVSLDLGVALAAGLPWVALVVWNTGTVFPATINAKRFFFAESFLPLGMKISWLRSALTSFTVTFGVLVLSVAFLALVPLGRRALLFAAVFLASYFSMFPGALSHNVQRYPVLLSPILLLGITVGLTQKQNGVRWLAQALLIAAVVQTAVTLPNHWQLYRDGQHVTDTELVSVAKFSNLHLPPGAKVLVHDAGYISYATKFPLIDLVGLKTPWAISMHKQLTYPTGGRERIIAIQEIAIRSQPNYLIVLDGWDSIFRITEALRSGGWSLLPVRLAEQSDSGLVKSQCYSIYQLIPPKTIR